MKTLALILFLTITGTLNFLIAQDTLSLPELFNEVNAIAALRERGIAESEIPGIVAYQKLEFEGQRDSTWQLRTFPPNPTPLAPCNNIDFENGTFTGWTGSTGYHPNYGGCCPTPGFVTAGMNAGTMNPNARHTIMSNGFDVYGGFPRVAPGGSYSVRLGNELVGGEAERITQTFTVSGANTSFTYQYAVVLYDPQHVPANQPYFEIKMTDQNNNLIPCSYYFVAAGQGIPGFMTYSSLPFIIYKPWTTANVDLTPYIGQDVTISFTVSDCGEGGHFGYAYLDASCLPFSVSQQDSLCTGNSIVLSAPPGSSSYLWTPGGATTQNITISAPGNYCVAMVSNTGCTTNVCQNVSQYPGPTAAFTITSGGCTYAATFADSSTTSNGTIVSWLWDFGDGNTSSQQNPTHVYATGGTYTISLEVTSSNGCATTITQQFTTGLAQSTFSNSTVCVGNATDFNFSIPGYSTWSWSFGDPASGANNSSALQNPSHVYSVSGTYNVTLIAATATGCTDTIVQSVIAAAPPVASFSSTILSSKNGSNTVSYINTSTGASSWSWAFGDGSNSFVENPVHMFNGSGPYSTTLVVSNQYGCADSVAAEIEFSDFSFYISNSFTPNHDGINDTYFGKGFGILEFHFMIFDRWGNLIFESNDINQAWDGKVQGGKSNEVVQEDVYVWKANLTDIYGQKHRYLGHVSVIK